MTQIFNVIYRSCPDKTCFLKDVFQSIPSIDGTCIDLERAKEQQEALVKVEENLKQLGHGFFFAMHNIYQQCYRIWQNWTLFSAWEAWT